MSWDTNDIFLYQRVWLRLQRLRYGVCVWQVQNLTTNPILLLLYGHLACCIKANSKYSNLVTGNTNSSLLPLSVTDRCPALQVTFNWLQSFCKWEVAFISFFSLWPPLSFCLGRTRKCHLADRVHNIHKQHKRPVDAALWFQGRLQLQGERRQWKGQHHTEERVHLQQPEIRNQLQLQCAGPDGWWHSRSLGECVWLHRWAVCL